jgi:glycosyltransferase involved in cell wall biosynthesis
MDKILTIAIPTHNRPNLLKRLVYDLRDADISELVEINVHDNSDSDVQNLNKLYCADVNYCPNLTNIGYAENIRACIKKAKGEYLFIISDDDIYNFSHIGSILKRLVEKKFDVLALMCNLTTDVSVTFNTLVNPPSSEYMKLGDILKNTEVVTPFNLLPSIIVKTSLMKKGENLLCEGDNDYMHSVIFLVGSDCDTKVSFDNSEFIVTYNVPEEIEFNLISILRSKEDVTDILKKKYNIIRLSGLEILEISKWCFMSNIGGNRTRYGFRRVLYFTFKSLKIFKLSPIFFLWLGLLPGALKLQIYELHLRLKSIKKTSRDI